MTITGFANLVVCYRHRVSAPASGVDYLATKPTKMGLSDLVIRVALLSLCVLLASARVTGHRFPCNGVSPNGHRWIYALAEHTATVTVHGWLATRDWVGTNKSLANFSIPEPVGSPHGTLPCFHSHEAIAPPGTNFTFAFATNPFRRVLTNAAHSGAISGTRFGFRNMTGDEAVASFRNFVMHRLLVKNNHMIPRSIWVQSSMLSHFPQPPSARQWIGRTSTLEASMRQLLSVLGYPPGIFNGFDSSHCGATCEANTYNMDDETLKSLPPTNGSRLKAVKGGNSSERRLEQGGWTSEDEDGLAIDVEADSPLPLLRRLLLRNAAASNEGVKRASMIPWYDEQTVAKVVALFGPDFSAFNFSKDPAQMWD